MLCKMVFQLSGKVVALYSDKSTAKSYLCNQGGTSFLFVYGLACHILNLADKNGINLIPAYICTHLNYLPWGRLVPEWHLLPHIAQVAFHLWGVNQRWICWHPNSNQCQLYYTLVCPLPVGPMGLNAFNHLWTYQVCYVFPAFALISLVLYTFLVEHAMG